jgi:hypothetical protein
VSDASGIVFADALRGAKVKNHFDRAAKDILAEALSRMAEVSTEVETSPDPRRIDVWSTPLSAPPPELGLSGRMAAQPCLIESYSATVRLEEALDCLRKLLGRRHELKRTPERPWREPLLWIVSTGMPDSALELGFAPADGWPPGVYALPPRWHALLVVRSELPRSRDTLLLRATGSGRVLREAMEDLLREPAGSVERGILTKHLARLYLELHAKPGGLTPEEKEFAMTGAEMLQELETKAWARGRDAGLERGREEEARRAVRMAFECRFGPMPSMLEAALAKVHDLDVLHLCHQACLRDSRDEAVRLLGAAIH